MRGCFANPQVRAILNAPAGYKRKCGGVYTWDHPTTGVDLATMAVNRSKKCSKETRLMYHLDPLSLHERADNKRYYNDNREACIARSRSYCLANRDARRADFRQWRKKNKHRLVKDPAVRREYHRQYYILNRQTILARRRERSREKRLARLLVWRSGIRIRARARRARNCEYSTNEQRPTRPTPGTFG